MAQLRRVSRPDRIVEDSPRRARLQRCMAQARADCTIGRNDDRIRVDPDRVLEQSRGWTAFYAELDPIMARGDPLAEDALALVRRMAALIRQTTRGDQHLWNRASQFWREAVNDPKIAPSLPMKKEHYEFVGKVMTELRRRGELSP